MNIQKVEKQGALIALVESDRPLITDVQSALDLMATVQYETGSRLMALPKAAFAEAFFELRTRLAGEVLQKYVNYGVKLAIFGDFSGYTSNALKSFIYESNRGNAVLFVPDAATAIERLAAAQP